MTICSTPVGAGYSLFSVLQKVSHFFCAVKRSRAYFAVVYKFLLQIYIFFCPESAAVGLTKPKKADILLLHYEICVMKYAWMRTSKPLPRGKENRQFGERRDAAGLNITSEQPD